MTWLPRKLLFGALLVAVAVGALFLAGGAEGDARYFGGLTLFVICILGVFGLISTGWGRSPIERLAILPSSGPARWAVGGLAAVAGIFGLFQAQTVWSYGYAYYNGLALFVLAVAYDFLLLKDWFDRSDARRR